MILDIEGRPTPNTEMVSRIKQIHPSLDLRYIRYPDPEGNRNAWWAFIEHWGENDPRREKIKTGDFPPDSAFDILGYLPLDCSVDQAYGFLVRSLKSDPSTRYRKHLDRIEEYNKGIVNQAKEEVLEYAEEVTKVNASTLLGDKSPVKVYQSGGKRR